MRFLTFVLEKAMEQAAFTGTAISNNYKFEQELPRWFVRGHHGTAY